MRSYQSSLIPIIAGTGYDRPSEVLRSSLEGAGTYNCENRHMDLIVAVDKRQNENKALQTKEIGQNKKKSRVRLRSAPSWGLLFPAVCWGNGSWWRRGFAPKVSASGPQQRRNGAFPSRPQAETLPDIADPDLPGAGLLPIITPCTASGGPLALGRLRFRRGRESSGDHPARVAGPKRAPCRRLFR
jgi:hypothetical protein